MAERNLAVRILIAARDEASGVLGNLKGVAAGVAAAIGTYFGAKLFKGSVEAAEALDVQMRKLEGVIHATGGAAGLTADELDTMARRLDEATTGSAAGFRDASAQLLTFKSVGKEVFEETLMLAQDLADSGFGSVTSNAVQLGKALEDPVRGMSALARSGVSFSATQEEVIKKLVETGRHAEAQRIILDAVAGQVGGTASAIGGGLTGALDLVGKRFTDLREQLGSAVLPVLTEFYNRVADLYGRLTESGVVKQFGEAIATVFRQASDAAFRFFDSFDLDQLITKLQAWGTSTRETVQQWSEYLSTASDVAKVAFGSISTGVAAIQSAFHGLAGVIADVLGRVTQGFADTLGFFGRFSSAAKAASEEAASIAAAFAASAAENYDKANAALDRTAERAQGLRSDFGELIGVESDLERQTQRTTTAIHDAGAAAEMTADALDELGVGFDYVDGKAQRASMAIAAAGGAATDAASQLRESAEAAIELESAYETLGITSAAALEEAARKAQQAFETIRSSGVATPVDIERAWTAYAQRAVAATNGVVSATLQAEAAAQGLRVTVDDAGRVIVGRMNEAAAATADVAATANQAATEYRQIAAAVRDAAGAIADLNTVAKKSPFGARRPGEDVLAGAYRRGYRVDAEDADEFRRLAETLKLQYTKEEERRFNNTTTWKSYAEAMERADRMAIEEAMRRIEERRAEEQRRRDRDTEPTSTAGPGGSQTARSRRSGTRSGASEAPAPASRTVNVNIALGGKQYAMPGVPAQSAKVLESMLRDLERDSRVLP